MCGRPERKTKRTGSAEYEREFPKRDSVCEHRHAQLARTNEHLQRRAGSQSRRTHAAMNACEWGRVDHSGGSACVGACAVVCVASALVWAGRLRSDDTFPCIIMNIACGTSPSRKIYSEEHRRCRWAARPAAAVVGETGREGAARGRGPRGGMSEIPSGGYTHETMREASEQTSSAGAVLKWTDDRITCSYVCSKIVACRCGDNSLHGPALRT
jgi:hypothetical protein